MAAPPKSPLNPKNKRGAANPDPNPKNKRGAANHAPFNRNQSAAPPTVSRSTEDRARRRLIQVANPTQNAAPHLRDRKVWGSIPSRFAPWFSSLFPGNDACRVRMGC